MLPAYFQKNDISNPQHFAIPNNLTNFTPTHYIIVSPFFLLEQLHSEISGKKKFHSFERTYHQIRAFHSTLFTMKCETNNLRFLKGYLVHIFHFKNVHYINITHIFKVKTMNKISLSKTIVYSFRISNILFFNLF